MPSALAFPESEVPRAIVSSAELVLLPSGPFIAGLRAAALCVAPDTLSKTVLSQGQPQWVSPLRESHLGNRGISEVGNTSLDLDFPLAISL